MATIETWTFTVATPPNVDLTGFDVEARDGKVGKVDEATHEAGGSFLVVELMRQGRSPHEACKEAVMRIVKKRREASKTLQVGFLAMNRDGEVGAYAIQHGFSYAVCDAKKQDALIPSQSVYTTSYS